jgi:hypothetical protein
VSEAGKTMREIVGSVQRVSDIIEEISVAATEQSDGIGQVSATVGELDRMTQQNAALVEESAAATESLKDQAAKLAQAVGVFKLADHAAAHEQNDADAGDGFSFGQPLPPGAAHPEPQDGRHGENCPPF